MKRRGEAGGGGWRAGEGRNWGGVGGVGRHGGGAGASSLQIVPPRYSLVS